MKPGLSLRVSQQLALTPQLQQSIRLLQLSTLELAGEVEQMLADNPFLEREDEAAPREEFGLAQADARVSAGDRADENAIDSGAAGADPAGADGDFEPESLAPGDWDGDGRDTIGVYRPVSGEVDLENELTGPLSGVDFYAPPDRLPVAGRWAGLELDTLAFFTGGSWQPYYWNRDGEPVMQPDGFTLGAAGDRPLAGRW